MFKPRSVAIAAGCVTAGIVIVNRMNHFKTPGIRNIEERHTTAGGGKNGTPSHGSKLGDKNSDAGAALEDKGIGSKHFREGYADQKVEPSGAGKAWNQTKHQQNTDVH